jgi:hypothetical protein
MLKQRSLLLYASGCIISMGSLIPTGVGGVITGAPNVHPVSATSTQGPAFQGLGIGDSGYLFQLASGSTNATPNRPSPYPSCPGGVTPDIPKPHDGGGGKKKMPVAPIVVPCSPAGGTAKHG